MVIKDETEGTRRRTKSQDIEESINEDSIDSFEE